MKGSTMKMQRLVSTYTFALVVVGALSACDTKTTCKDLDNCATEAMGGAGTGGATTTSPGTGLTCCVVGGSTGSGGAPNTGGAATGGAPPCNGACTGPTPICEVTLNQCVTCTKDANCPNNTVCDTGRHVCVGCTKNTNCAAPKAVCATDNTCVECLASTDCTYSTSKPVCKTESAGSDAGTESDAGTADVLNICVECLASTDCKDSTKPQCSAATRSCVACLSNTDCKTAGASKRDLITGSSTINTCVPCTADNDCTQISGKNACLTGVTGQANQCVTCTATNESACGANSCNPKTNVCTSTPKGSVDLCGACAADSECTNGVGTILARCIPMTFGSSAAAHGNYCLAAVSSGCAKPYGNTSVMAVTAVSASGVASADYCGINQELVTCEAIRDMIDPSDTIRCTNTTTSQPDDTLCGCTRNALGTCTSAGQGGLCKNISGANRCTIQCATGANCTADRTCVSAAQNYCG